MTAEIITIGDELLVGQVVNTNASWIAGQLNDIGIRVVRIVAIADEKTEIIKALEDAQVRADIILLTGGLGPTNDDITKFAFCDYFNAALVFHEPSFRMIESFFNARGIKVIERNRKQAEIPSNCTPILNRQGTAPGMWFEKEGKIIISMPGVPFEMEAMMENDIIPLLQSKDRTRFVIHRTILTTGIGESFLAEMIRKWEESLPSNIKLAYLPQPGIVRLRLTATGDRSGDILRQITDYQKKLEKLIPDLIFGYDNETLEGAVGKLLKDKHKSISTAESCTGGYIAHLITSIPGASDYYSGSVVAYSNDIKEKLLEVSHTALISYGAVSEEVVKEMALGVRRKFQTDYSIATSGIAGPDGGTPEKPVGLVWIAVDTPEGVTARKYLFGEHRERNIRRAALASLNMLRLTLK